ncbi:uncharacterized protein BDZ99DRAFT_71997 [Mytilinidion resinicola]|uniref:C2H2-type domain-containing protein n=1 Tax=Mytilinidion resinicola TaxID=574789 RepID=A0A6A6YGV1_9PEZI|nr:uncharacterized protein BDZ99DRAFT_71997 [Mytilinidion resinicola]KAF2808046.1 hypothetical protein BDZ99DRAFT_71997 [Mytilinidion resinicola]
MASPSELSIEEHYVIQELLNRRTAREWSEIFSRIDSSHTIYTQLSRPESLISVPSLRSDSSLSGRYPASSASSVPSFRQSCDTSGSATSYASQSLHKLHPQHPFPLNPGSDRFGPKIILNGSLPYNGTSALPATAALSQRPLGYEDILCSREFKKPSEPTTMLLFCTFCAEQGLRKTFKKKADWKKHESVFHETGKEWQCEAPRCFRIFGREIDFSKHQKEHPEASSPCKQLPEKVAFGCGFNSCGYVAYHWNDRCNHVATCQSFLEGEEWEYSTKIRNLLAQKSIRDEWKTIRNETCSRLHIDHKSLRWTPETSTALRRQLECNQFGSLNRFLLEAVELGQGALLLTDTFVPPKAQSTTERQTPDALGSHAQFATIGHHNQGSFEPDPFLLQEVDITQHTNLDTPLTSYYTDNIRGNGAPTHSPPPNTEPSCNRMSYVMDENASLLFGQPPTTLETSTSQSPATELQDRQRLTICPSLPQGRLLICPPNNIPRGSSL